jgi:D-sedoheptulose 7-phosphate isomerase
LQASINAKQQFIESSLETEHFVQAATLVAERYRQGGRLYVAGNGGSAADAQHLVAEFVSKLSRDRSPLPAEALTVDTSILTAIGNDYGYEKIFSRQIEGKMTPKDILEALHKCQELNIPSIVFSGRDGGPAAKLSDFCVIAPGEMTSTIQEIHIVLAHTLCECVEYEIFN